jgi:hypothetical protein
MADAGVKRIDATDPSAVVRRPGRDLLILCLTTLVLLLRFIARPLHVDDPLFVWTARQIVSHPLDFYGFAVNWSGHPIPMASEMLNPPLLPFYLAVATRLFGAGEIVWHLSLLPISLLAVIGMYTLAGNYCRSPLPATLMLLLSPAFLVSATTIMCDVPVAVDHGFLDSRAYALGLVVAAWRVPGWPRDSHQIFGNHAAAAAADLANFSQPVGPFKTQDEGVCLAADSAGDGWLVQPFHVDSLRAGAVYGRHRFFQQIHRAHWAARACEIF